MSASAFTVDPARASDADCQSMTNSMTSTTAERKEKRLAERLMAIGRPGLELPAVGNYVAVMNFGTRQEFSGA